MAPEQRKVGTGSKHGCQTSPDVHVIPDDLHRKGLEVLCRRTTADSARGTVELGTMPGADDPSPRRDLTLRERECLMRAQIAHCRHQVTVLNEAHPLARTQSDAEQATAFKFRKPGDALIAGLQRREEQILCLAQGDT